MLNEVSELPSSEIRSTVMIVLSISKELKRMNLGWSTLTGYLFPSEWRVLGLRMEETASRYGG